MTELLPAIQGYDWAKAFEVAGPPDNIDNAYGCDNTPDIRRAPPLTDVSTEPFQRADVTSISHCVEGENDGPDWLCVGQLRDGRWFCLRAGCDYTGWDCQSGGNVEVGLTYDDIVRFGLGNDERDRLGLALTEPELAT